MNKFKVGDKVKVIPRSEAPGINSPPMYIREMANYGELIAIVEKSIGAFGGNCYILDICPSYKWLGTWLEPIFDVDQYLLKDKAFDI